MNISRFSRNVSKGLELARLMRYNNLYLVSAIEMVDISSASGEYNLIGLLNASEFESKQIGMRVRDALVKKKSEGNVYGPPPYGLQVQWIDGKRKFVECKEEGNIIAFIQACKTVGTSLGILNEKMRTIYQGEDFVPIGFDTRYKKVMKPGLTDSNIAELLNSYSVTNRGKTWVPSAIRKIIKRQASQDESTSLD